MKKIYILLITFLPLLTVVTLAVGYPGDEQVEAGKTAESNIFNTDAESNKNFTFAKEAGDFNDGDGAGKFSTSGFAFGSENAGYTNLGLRGSFNYPSAVMPITILNLHGTATNGLVQLMFTTSDETKVFQYNVQSSIDGRNWNEVSSVASKSNNYGSSYQFTDTRKLQGLQYYRIKATSLDGSYKYSNIILLRTDGGSKIELMANVVTSTLGFYITDANPVRLNVLVYGTDGKLYSKATVQHNNGKTNFSIPVGQLYRGNYVVRFIGEDGFSYSARFLKQ